jgi:purine-binding chemotaxis protein CheW
MISKSTLIVEEPEDSSNLQEIETVSGELHLRFFVPSGKEFAIPAAGIREVMAPAPDRITPMPNVSPLLLGTINLRGRVIWVADLGYFLGDTAPLDTDRFELPVIAIEDQEIMLGLAVDRIGNMDWLNPQELQMPINSPDSLTPFLSGEWLVGDDAKEFVYLLDPVAILRSARWAG